jgi:hypothetical protein
MTATISETLRQISDLFLQLADQVESDHGKSVDDLDVDARSRRCLPQRNDEFPNIRLKWSEEDIRKLLMLHELGVAHGEIAKVLGRTEPAIQSKLFHPTWGIFRKDDELASSDDEPLGQLI